MQATKTQQLAQLQNSLAADNPCPKLAASATQLVFGSGDINADLLFVGEAPGKKEDLTGKPFVGASGKFLDKMLDSVELKRSDIYITNIVKYRPPDNRDPKPAEKEAFWPYLIKQIAIIEPKIVVTLGRHSGQAFISDLRIGADHGILQALTVTLEGKQHSISVLPLYHPAAALYNGSLKTTLLDDFQIVRKYM